MHNSNAGDGQLAILVIGAVLVAAGFLWIRRITAGEGGDGTSPWRYHKTDDRRDVILESAIRDIYLTPPEPPGPALEERIDKVFAESFARARRGRRMAKEMFAAAWLTILLAAFLTVAAPAGPQPMGVPRPDPLTSGPTLLGLSGIAIGLIWMWRILRADPEAGAPPWRHRDF
jgi:hypothetical protein